VKVQVVRCHKARCTVMGRELASLFPCQRDLRRPALQGSAYRLHAYYCLFLAFSPLLVMQLLFLSPLQQRAVPTLPHRKPSPHITRRAFASGSNVYSLAECSVQTPLDTAVVRLESWMVRQRGQDDFIREVEGKHRSLHRDFEQRNLRRYEKSVFQLFNVRCWPQEGPLTEAGVCAECHRARVRKVPSALGELLLPEIEVETNVDMQTCFEGPADENPQCLRSFQTLASDAILNVPFPMGQDDD